MTEEQLKFARLEIKIYALRHVVCGLLAKTASAGPAQEQLVLARLAELTQRSGLPLSQFPAEWSDLLASEFQEAFGEIEACTKQLLPQFKKP